MWGCVSHDCKLDLVTVQGNLNALRYLQLVSDLEAALQQEWGKLPQRQIQSLIEGMRRLEAVVRVRRGYTR